MYHEVVHYNFLPHSLQAIRRLGIIRTKCLSASARWSVRPPIHPSVRPSVSPRFPHDGFALNLILGTLWRSVEKTQNWLKFDKKNVFGTLHEDIITFVLLTELRNIFVTRQQDTWNPICVLVADFNSFKFLAATCVAQPHAEGTLAFLHDKSGYAKRSPILTLLINNFVCGTYGWGEGSV